MNRALLLKQLAGLGYKPENPSLEGVQKFLTDENITLQNEAGEAVDVAKAWSVEAAAPSPKPARTVQVSTEDLDEVKKQAKAWRESEAAKAAGRMAGSEQEPQTFNIGNSQRKAYAARVASQGIGNGRFQAKYADPDTAEICTAIVRMSMCGGMDYKQRKNDADIVQKAQVEFSNTLGGYLVPTEFVSNLIYLTEPYGVARRIANVVRMTREIQGHPRKTSIPTMTWAGEAQTGSVVNNSYDLVELGAKKLQLIMQASSELLEDAAINVADDIATSVREAYDKAIDSAYLLGDGTSTYGGFMGLANALPSGAYFNASGAWSAFTTGDFNLALGRLENVDMNRVGILCSRQFYHQVCMRLEKATSQFKTLVEGPKADGSFLGFPVYFSQTLPTTSGSGTKSVYVGDFIGASMIGERRDLNIMASEHSAFTSDSIQWRATARASVAVHGDGKGSTYGPIVCLKATG